MNEGVQILTRQRDLYFYKTVNEARLFLLESPDDIWPVKLKFLYINGEHRNLFYKRVENSIILDMTFREYESVLAKLQFDKDLNGILGSE